MGAQSMRLWVVHPKYLDCKAIVALWREGLLARKVLQGKTKGYKNHPQLQKFKTQKNPVGAIDTYLLYVWKEANMRCYNFNREKIGKSFTNKKIGINKKEIMNEFELLKNKLKKRNYTKYKEIIRIREPEVNPLFFVKG